GPNGAGKTTLIRILAGLSRPTKGAVKLFGQDASVRATRAQVGIIGHGIGIYDELSALENLKLFAGLYALESPGRVAEEWLEKTGLARVKDGLVREFSRGMRQRLAVARAFLHNPRLLLLDEPFTALDDRAIALLQGLLRDALREGRTVLMSTHQLREALELATHVVLINRGKLAHTGERTAEMLADPGYLYRVHGEA
ncbi:MAG TPA: heme ABC exporter ATP-binding protein CcmA, partial [Solibacterales bacterium]|nr:heme ABC exporter ATP-binding protein CcmA [Bryobacterales bacterium]